MAYTTEQLMTIAGKLDELPEIERRKQQHNKKEAIRLLARHITSALRRGYTLAQLAEFLRAEGLDITERTLRNHLQQLKRPAKKVPTTQKSAPQKTVTRGTKNNPESGTRTSIDRHQHIADLHRKQFG